MPTNCTVQNSKKKYLDVPESFEMDAGLYCSYDIKEALEIIEFI